VVVLKLLVGEPKYPFMTLRGPRSGRSSVGAIGSVLAGLALLLAGGAGAVAAPTPPTSTTSTPSTASNASARPAITRLSGSDRYATAAAISQATFGPGVPIAYVATGQAFPDALAGAAAAAGRGPVLLTRADRLPAAAALELKRLAPAKLVVLGGPASVSDATLSAASGAAGGVATSRLAGADRYATAATISAATFRPGVPVAYLATGVTFADALAGAAAGAGRAPVLLTTSDDLPAATATELKRLAPARIVVLGSTSSISDTVATAASAASSASFTRLAGVDEFGDAAAISEASFAPGAPGVFLATATNYADALAGAAATGGRGPVILVEAGTLPNVEAGELRRLHAGSTTVFGGTSAVSDTVARSADIISGQGIPVPSSSAAAAVSLAQAQIGKPYLWGGSGPDSFDCSGLTAYVWKPAGVALVHNAAMQDDQVASIPVSAAAPGDLLFYGSPVYHVAVYAGNGQMIEAAHTGTPVRLVPVRTQDLADAGRPLS
jgi:cell wall-associated NlpC family hydrolase